MPSTPWPRSASCRRPPRRPSASKGENAVFDVARIDAIEREVKHDVIAFLTHLAEIVGPEARFVHQGLTSSDILDTCFNVQLVRAADLLMADVDALLAALKRRAYEHKDTVDDRPEPRHPRRADDLRPQARLRLRRVRPRPPAAPCRPRGSRDRGPLRRRRHLRQCRSAGRGARRPRPRPPPRADLDPGDPARPPRHVFRHARRRRLLGRAARDRDPPPAADRGARGRGVFLARPEGLLGDAAQAEPGALREPHRPRPPRPLDGACRPWRTWRSGTSATSRIPRSSASSAPTRRSRSTSRSHASPA